MPYRENAIRSLIHYLDNGNEADRCYAARSLGEIRADSATNSLIARLRDDDIDVCIDAITALGQIGKPDALDSLLEALKNEADGEVKTAIATSLGCFNDPSVKKTLTQLAINRPEELEDDADDWDRYWDIQLEAIKSLTRQGGTDRTDEIASLIDDEDGQDIEAEILKVLAHSGDAGFTHLQRKLDGTSARTRRRAAQALRFQNSNAAKLALQQALKDDEAQVRTSALESIAYMQASELLRDVIALLSDNSAQVRQTALKVLSALGKSGGESILTPAHLLPLLADNNSDVRLSILAVLKDLAQQKILTLTTEQLKTLKTCLNSMNPDEASLACTIIADLQDKSAIDSLINILENTEEDEMLRKEATISLGKLGIASPNVMQVLQKHLAGESRVIRLAVLQTLMALEQATQDTQVLTVKNTQNQSAGDSETNVTHAISDPMALLLASLYGEAIPDPNAVDSASDKSGLSDTENTQQADRIDLVHVEEDASDEALSSPAYDASQSTLASLQADQPLIPEDYSSDYRDLEGTDSPEANSTLAALTQDNVAATLMSDRPVEPHVQSIMNMVRELPEDLSDFGDAVRANNAAAEQMIDQGRRTPIKHDVRHLAARALATMDVSSATPNQTRRDKVDRVIEGLVLALSDQDEQLRCEAADTLYQLACQNPKTPGLSNALGGLVTQLQFGTPDFRVKAVRALGPLQHKAAIPPLIDSLSDTHNLVRIHAIVSLGQLINAKWSEQEESHHMVLEDVKSERIVRHIIQMLDDPDNGVRKAAIDVLSDHQQQLAVDKMIHIALENEGAMARVVGKALRKMKASEAGNTVSSRLEGAENSADRRFLMEILEEMYKPA